MQLDSAITRVYGESGTVGVGLLVADRDMVTASFVVSLALGARSDKDTLPSDAEVEVDFPLVAPGKRLRAKVLVWQPMREDRTGGIAGLRFLSPLPAGIRPVELMPSENLWGHNFRAFGFPHGYDIGVWVTGQLTGRGVAGWIQMQSDPIGHPVSQGFAGTPVWDDHLDGVIGMVLMSSADSDKTRQSFCIPSELLIENWQDSGAYVDSTTQRFGVGIDVLASNMAAKLGASQVPSTDTPSIFVVHGHNERYKEAVARVIERSFDSGEVIILHEQPNRGQAIIEKFERYASSASFAVVLMTGDDEGGEHGTQQLRPRARQNVVLELGYFIGKLGRDRVVVLHEDEVEIPGDVHGVVYIPLDSAGRWRYDLMRELKVAGLAVDFNRII